MVNQPYKIIYADPPWQYNFPNTRSDATPDDYSTMKTAEICALPISKIADENCLLFIWGIWPKLKDCMEVIKAWGFDYKTVAFVWVKTKKNAAVDQLGFFPADSFEEFFGMGNWTRSNTEFCLLAGKGRVERQSAAVRQIIYAPVQEHSRKPAETRDRIIQLVGDLPRVELFARQRHEGWHVWGNEVESDVELAA
ncbi:MAG TPA: MT-A70 family methyltransferase [Pyrinomonadaceae bacterium]|nr:MT-A70 family methyltransferase [Pyrinomonadaceae bacterium]